MSLFVYMIIVYKNPKTYGSKHNKTNYGIAHYQNRYTSKHCKDLQRIIKPKHKQISAENDIYRGKAKAKC
jgi:hypothetical protein